MKKSKKFWTILSTSVVLTAATATLLGIFIPQIINKKALAKLAEKQVKPSEGQNNYLKYDLKSAAGKDAGSLNNIETIVKNALANEGVAGNVTKTTVSNYLTQFFKTFTASDAYTSRYKTWVEDIDKDFDNLVKSYKKDKGGTWEFYFQVNELDPVGGNVEDWKRSKLQDKVNSAFDDFLFQDYHINALREDDTVINPTSKPSSSMLKYLYSDKLVNGTGGTGTPNRVQFVPNDTQAQTTPYSVAVAKLQEFIFNEYIASEMPLVTSMVLFKHITPQNDGKSDYFNVEKAKNQVNPNAPEDVVASDASYAWQTFPKSQPPWETPEGSGEKNATDKYLDFAAKANDPSKPFIDGTTGAINIPVEPYTDDSATLYFIKLSDVYNSSYPQYAAAANYKFNTLLNGTLPGGNIPGITSLSTTNINTGRPGTEIMSNFLGTSGTLELPKEVQDIINDDPNYNFVGSYNGATHISDTLDITGSPFITTRNEAGVHVIGIDRYDQISAANGDSEKVLTEIRNTVLWRYILGEFSAQSNTGFTLDLKSELKTFYDENRNQILFDYILQNEATPPADEKEYIFSDSYCKVSALPILTDNSYVDYITAWNDYKKYNKKLSTKSTITEKVNGLQDSYLENIYGKTVTKNGLAGVLPYGRNTTEDTSPTQAAQVVDKNFGSYQSLGVYEENNPSNVYTETGLSAKKTIIKNNIDDLYESLNTNNKIIRKNLTFSSAKYNQYLLIDVKTPEWKNTNEYSNYGSTLTNSINDWIISDDIKNTVEIEKMIADINYDNDDGSGGADFTMFDNEKMSLSGAYGDIATRETKPATPSNTSATEEKSKFVDHQLQYAYDINRKLSNETKFADYLDFTGNQSYDKFLQKSLDMWTGKFITDKESIGEYKTFLNDVASMKHAFDYNEKTNEFEFKKYRQFLLNQTSNDKQASYVWTTNEKVNLIDGYKDTSSIKDIFTFKEHYISKDLNPFGYAYADSAIPNIKESNGKWAKSVTFDESDGKYKNIPLTDGGSSFTGFQGMQFESNVSSTLPQSIRESLFNNDLKVYDGYNVDSSSGTPSTADIKSIGVLYNQKDIDGFASSVQSNVFNWGQVNKLLNWFSDSLGLDVSHVSKVSIKTAKTQIIEIIKDGTSIPSELFDRNQNALLVNAEASLINPDASEYAPYFFENDKSKGLYSTAAITQFANRDVVALFDTTNDGKIDNNDIGINWDVVATDGFLGASSEAFFMSAFEWYSNQTSYNSITYNEMFKRQEKVNVYDRRINDSLGEKLVKNYKENNAK
ncbi:MAG: DUF3713 domain-containing protein [Mycoplasma sp.]